MLKILGNSPVAADLQSACVYIALLVLGVLPLLFNVVRYRIRHRVLLGDGGQEMLTRAIRCHGNYVENVPFALVLLLALGVAGAPALWIHATGLAMICGRIFHAIGILRANAPTPERGLGMLLSNASFVIGSLGLLWHILD